MLVFSTLMIVEDPLMHRADLPVTKSEPLMSSTLLSSLTTNTPKWRPRMRLFWMVDLPRPSIPMSIRG